ncbi:MAG: CehA/McbA family metallohydrolase [Chloroflexota bacterium]
MSKIYNPNPNWYRGDFHAHTLVSPDGHHPPDEFAALAKAEGLDFVSMTDHNLIGGWDQVMEDIGILVMPGVEVTFFEGHWNVFPINGEESWLVGLSELYIEKMQVAQNMSNVTKIMKAAVLDNQLNSINHPCLPPWAWLFEETDLRDVHCVEIVNDPTFRGSKKHPSNLEATIDAVAMWTRWLNAGHRITAIGGSDYHGPHSGGGGYNPTISQPATYVYASELSVNGIIQGLRQRRAYVARVGQATFTAETDNQIFDIGQDMRQINGDVTFSGELQAFPQGCTVRIIKNGDTVSETSTEGSATSINYEDSLVPDTPAWYRLEAVKPDGEYQLVTNPIFAGPQMVPTKNRYGDFL